MLNTLVKKILRVLLVLFGVILVMFLLIHLIPGNPWGNLAGTQRAFVNYEITEATLRELNRHFGFDLPLWRQFTRYLIGDTQEETFVCGVICGNLGPSTSQAGRSVQSILFSPPRGRNFWQSEFGYSIRLVLFASVFVIGLGVPLGIIAAKNPQSKLSRSISLGMAGLVSIPNFVLGLLAVLLFASWLHIINVLPDWDKFTHWIIPAFVLAALPMANIARVMQASMVNIQNEDYVRTARAKGLTESRVVLVHIMRNALVPFITYLGPTLIELLAGLFIVESLYSFPGFGRQYWYSILKLDYPMILGLTLIYATGIALVSIIIEILTEIIDPRLIAVKDQNNP